jgi:hypothetical protein
MKVISEADANELARSKEVVPLEDFPGVGYSAWKVRCKACSQEITTTYNKLRGAKEIGCAACSKAIQAKLRGYKLTKSKLRENNWELLTPLENYQDSKSIAMVKCVLCGKPEEYFPHLLIHKMCSCEVEKEAQAKLEKGQEFAKSRGGVLLSEKYLGSKEHHIWRCAKGHTWPAQFGSVASKGGVWCPYCSGRLAIEGVNDLETNNPLLALEFDSQKNSPLELKSLKPNSSLKVWWRCGLQHSFDATVSNRHHLATGCPYCSGHKVLSGFNDLQTLKPEIASLWHPSKNGKLLPSEVSRTANKKIYWLCELGHETFNDLRTKVATRGSCSTCSGKLLAPGVNDLATKRPDLAAEWHPTLNGTLSPRDLTPHSNKSVWWLCERGHHWKKDCGGRAQGRGCPFCAYKKCWPGFNDLATTHPDLLEEWDWERNTIDPSSIITGGRHKVFWICTEGHESYLAATVNRAFGSESGCPKCSEGGYKIVYRGLLYLIENDVLLARKIGITNSHKNLRRLEAFEKNGWRRISVWEHENGIVAKHMETALLKGWLRREFELKQVLEKREMSGLNGHTETFSLEGPSNSEIVTKANSLFGKLAKAVETDSQLVAELLD